MKILIATNHSYMLYRFRRELVEALMQAHEAASGAYFLAALLHMATSPKASGCKAASGAAAFAVSVVLIADCHMAKDQTSKMQRHRIYSAALAAAAALHAF